MSALARRRYRCFISFGACCAFARSIRATALFVLLDQVIVTIPLATWGAAFGPRLRAFAQLPSSNPSTPGDLDS
jgi:hypothetical protein